MINRDLKKDEFEDFEDSTSEFDSEIDGDDESGSDVQTALTAVVASTPVDFARMGITQMAYIRETVVNETPMWGIFSAAGDPLGAAPSFDLAWAAVRQHDLQPMRVH